MKKISVLILLVIMQLTLFSQNSNYLMQLNKTLTNSRVSVIPTPNEEIAVWIENDLELYKFDKCGNSLWNKKFAFPNFTSSCIQNEMISTKTGGYAFLTRETTGAIISSRVTMLDALGNILWSKVYTIPSYTICSYSLMEDNAGNIFIYGNTDPLGGGTAYNVLIKLQANGTQLWSNTYDLGGTWGQAIATSDNGALLRSGRHLIKVNSLGVVQWVSRNWAPNFDYHYAPVEVIDGYIFTSAAIGISPIHFLKIDKSGNRLWGGTKKLNFLGINRKLVKMANGNIVSVFNKTISGKNLPTIIEFDKDLNVVATNSIKVSQPDLELIGHDINFMDNRIPILVGTIDSLGNTKPFVAKLKINYQSGCDRMSAISFGIGKTSHSLVNTLGQPINITEVNTVSNPTPFTVTSSVLCSASKLLFLDLGKDSKLCPNSSITLENLTPSKFDAFLWSTGETTSSISLNSAGSYWLTATDICTGVSLSDTIIISNQDFPDPTNLPNDTILCLDNSILLDAQHVGGVYKWQDGSVEQYFSALIPNLYSVDITYEGCTKRFYSEVIGCEESIIPNVFTPNGDGLNDLFEIIYNGDQEYSLIIYNRWGQQVFKTNDKTHFWNGDVKGKKAASGSYYYVFSFGDQSEKGSLTLFR